MPVLVFEAPDCAWHPGVSSAAPFQHMSDLDENSNDGEEEGNTILGPIPPMERDEFYQKLTEFMEKRGTPLPAHSFPFAGQTIDLYVLWGAVQKAGGYYKSLRRLRFITPLFKFQKSNQRAIFALRLCFECYLYAFERVLGGLPDDPKCCRGTPLECARAATGRCTMHTAH